jgi:hypothetical protein
MRVINIIESTFETPVKSIESFGVFEEQLSQEVVEQAEKLFVKLAVDNGAIEIDAEACLDDGYYSNGNYTVSIAWSNI